jgi:tetratricopeptide (TPR) repeat protein
MTCGLSAKAHESATKALELFRLAGDDRGIADALLAQSSLAVAEPLPHQRRRALAEEALVHARGARDSRLVASALTEMALAVPPEPGFQELERAARAFREIGGRRGLIQLYSDASYGALKIGRADLARRLVDRALPLARELGDPHELVFVWGNVGLDATLNGDLDRAQAAFTQQLRLCLQLVDDRLAPEGLGGMAAVAAGSGDPERAARLLGAASAMRGPIADAELMRQLERELIEPARASYGARRWNGQQAAGAELSFEEAITFALRSDRTHS